MITDINSEDRLVQQPFNPSPNSCATGSAVRASTLYSAETFGPYGTLGRVSERDVVLVRDLRVSSQTD